MDEEEIHGFIEDEIDVGTSNQVMINYAYRLNDLIKEIKASEINAEVLLDKTGSKRGLYLIKSNSSFKDGFVGVNL